MMKDEATRLAVELGYAVFPVWPRSKKPRIKGWPTEATTDVSQINAWWTQWPDANIGVVTGPKSNLVVVDVDVKSGGMKSLEELKARIPEMADTLEARTGSGGSHLYYHHDGTPPVRNSASDVAPGIDVRGEGGYVVAPPSMHENGSRYQWVNRS